MKDIYVADLRVDQEVQDFFRIKSVAVKTGVNKKKYLDLMLCDKTGEISAKKWDVSESELTDIEAFADGDIIKVKALVTEWGGSKQLKIARIRKSKEEDQVSIREYIKAAPEDGENMLAYIKGAVIAMSDEDLKTLCLKILTDNEEKLLYYPAAVKNHHAEMAGLLYHMKRMLEMAERVCDVYQLLNSDLVKTGVIMHDIEKLNEIEADRQGVGLGYSFEGRMLGHLVQGAKLISRLCEELNISKEKSIMLEHMMISHHYEAEYGSPKKPLFPEAEILHYLDMIDARMYDMEEALSKTDPGAFSDRVWTMDNRTLYKPSEDF